MWQWVAVGGSGWQWVAVGGSGWQWVVGAAPVVPSAPATNRTRAEKLKPDNFYYGGAAEAPQTECALFPTLTVGKIPVILRTARKKKTKVVHPVLTQNAKRLLLALIANFIANVVGVSSTVATVPGTTPPGRRTAVHSPATRSVPHLHCICIAL